MTVSLTLRSERVSLPPWWHHPAPTGVLCFVRKKSSSERLVFIHREPGIQSSGISSHSVLRSWVIWVCPWSTLSGADAVREMGCFPRSLKETGMLPLYHTAPCSSEQTACFLQYHRRQLEQGPEPAYSTKSRLWKHLLDLVVRHLKGLKNALPPPWESWSLPTSC